MRGLSFKAYHRWLRRKVNIGPQNIKWDKIKRDQRTAWLGKETPNRTWKSRFVKWKCSPCPCEYCGFFRSLLTYLILAWLHLTYNREFYYSSANIQRCRNAIFEASPLPTLNNPTTPLDNTAAWLFCKQHLLLYPCASNHCQLVPSGEGGRLCSSRTLFSIRLRHMGQSSTCNAHLIQTSLKAKKGRD